MRAPCSVEGCGRASHARGLCKKHYDTQIRYHADPAARERNLARSKARYLADPDKKIAQAAAWKAKNPRKAKRHGKAFRQRFIDNNGCSHQAKYRPGMPCRVVAGGKEVWGLLTSGATRVGWAWKVWISLPWGEIVQFETKEVQL